jgi:hypothetical protein
VKRFAVHDSSGRILRIGTCQDRDLELQARPGESVVEIPKDVEVEDEQYFEIKEGKLSHNPAKEASIKAARIAAGEASRTREADRQRRLQDIIDGKGTTDQRLAELAKIVKGS